MGRDRKAWRSRQGTPAVRGGAPLDAGAQRRGLSSPPVISDAEADSPTTFDVLPLVQFPRYLVCPSCDRLAVASAFDEYRPGSPVRVCKLRGCDGAFATPVRFVMACDNGHLDDFEWRKWSGCTCDPEKAKLTLKQEGAGLAGLIVRCTRCNEWNSMDKAFDQGERAAKKIFCTGRHHWATRQWEQCRAEVHVLQRGASSLFFPSVRSIVSIPPYTDGVQEALGPKLMGPVKKAIEKFNTREKFAGWLESWFDINDFDEDQFSRPLSVIATRLLQWHDQLNGTPDDAPERWDEWAKIIEGLHNEIREEISTYDPPATWGRHFMRCSKALWRLRRSARSRPCAVSPESTAPEAS